MSSKHDLLLQKFRHLQDRRSSSELEIFTMGTFQVWRNGKSIESKDWGRDKTLQLFQYLLTMRYRRGMHKEQIIDNLWEEAGSKDGDRDFKVALHGIYKALEPDRTSRSESRYIVRQGSSYYIDTSAGVWVDTDEIQGSIEIANQLLGEDDVSAADIYANALKLHHGIYLPNRIYEDWSSEERERLQVLILGSYINLAELKLSSNPLESIRLSQLALAIDSGWEDAYRIQMEAYLQRGNRPQAIKVYELCEKVLREEFGLEPLPETRNLFRSIKQIH